MRRPLTRLAGPFRPAVAIAHLSFRSFQIQLEQPREDFVVGKIGGPAIGGGDGGIEFAVDQGEPRRPFVVEVRQRSLGQLLGTLFVLWDKSRVADRPDADL